MGMDVIGTNPTKPVGEYFRRNVWGWRPLWNYCLDTFEVSNNVEGHYNNGDGLDRKGALLLAKQIRESLTTGDAERYIAERNEMLAGLERPTCKYCEGTGIRTDEVATQMGMPERELSPEMASLTGRTHGFCNGCSGEGKTDAWETNYFLDLDDIKEFADFLEHSGGFQIC